MVKPTTVNKNTKERKMIKMEKYKVWLEGYVCTGQRAGAEYLGEFEGTSFEDACLKASLAKFGPKETANFYDTNRNTFWGCHFYNNESDARKTFG